MKCKLCENEFSDDSYKNKVYCSSKCKSKAYYYANQGNCYAIQKDRGLIRKLDLIERSGGKCESCGYDKNIAALTFHHIDPKLKSFELDMRNLSNHSQKVIDKEFEKCMLLCANCHFELHNPTYDKNKMEKYEGEKPRIHKIDSQKCEKCNVELNSYRKYCDKCLKPQINPKDNLRKTARPDKKTLEIEIWKIPSSKIAVKYNVSSTTVKKWCKFYGIDKPPVGYWIKKQ